MKLKLVIVTLLLLGLFVSPALSDTNWEKPATIFNYSVTVTNASAEILAERLAGRDVFIQNNDAAGIVYLAFDSTAATAANTVLQIAAGGTLFLENCTNSINAIGSIASNANVVIVERRK